MEPPAEPGVGTTRHSEHRTNMDPPPEPGTAQEVGSRRGRPTRQAASSSRAESQQQATPTIDHQVGVQPSYSARTIVFGFELAATRSTTRSGVRPMSLSEVGAATASSAFRMPSTSGYTRTGVSGGVLPAPLGLMPPGDGSRVYT